MKAEAGTLIDAEGREKYLSDDEVERLLAHSGILRPYQRAYLLTLYYTGARMSEALALRKRDIGMEKGRIAIRTLKRRQSKPVWRLVPVPAHYLETLDMTFDLRRGDQNARLWHVTARQARRWIKAVMEAAGLEHHSTHALRHTFGVKAVMRGVPLPTVQKWLGHAHVVTTSIYTTAGGAEEDELSRRMWRAS